MKKNKIKKMKNKKIIRIFVSSFVILAFILGLLNLITNDVEAGGKCGGGGCHGGGGGGSGQISELEKQAILTAIDGEYYAKAVYQKVIDTFGPISPFPTIRNQEQCHINKCANLLNTYGIPIPSDPWMGNIGIVFTSKHQACEIGVQAELENGAMYEILLQNVDNSDIVWTFNHLRQVSLNNHYPSFLNWADYYESIGE